MSETEMPKPKSKRGDSTVAKKGSEARTTTAKRSGGVDITAEELRAQDVAGRDIIKSITINGPIQIFIGDYEPLEDAYIDPWSIFERTHLDHFSGRKWLLSQIDSFLRTHNCGYLIVEAEAGLGKTTFLALLARERGYIHHFAELAPGPDRIEDTLKSLAAQLILAYKLGADVARSVIPKAATRPDYLSRLLKQAAKQRKGTEKIVLVIDALDLAGTPQDQNVLGLPTTLPQGVYIVVSQRPVPVTLQVETSTTPHQVVHLSATSKRNQADMQLLLKKVTAWPGVAKALQHSHYDPKRFTRLLLKKSNGVWVYLHYVLYEVEHSERLSPGLITLPVGLTEYFINIWQQWRKKKEWNRLYLPLLATLAAAHEGLTIDCLAKWAGLPKEKQKIDRLLNDEWRPFLAITGKGRQARYSFYHATLHEFFQGRLSRRNLQAAERNLLEEVALATSDARQSIIELLHKEMHTAKKPQTQRDAAFSLIRMDWLGHGRSISPDEMIAYLEIVARYVDTSFECRYLIRHITAMLDTCAGTLSKHQESQLRVYRAAMFVELNELDEGTKDYTIARHLAAEVAKSESGLPEDCKLVARVNLGAGTVFVIRAENLTAARDVVRQREYLQEAVKLYHEAIRFAQGQDVVLELTIYGQLCNTYTRLKDWEQAEQTYADASTTFQRIEDEDDRILYRAWMLEIASELHREKGRSMIPQHSPSAWREYEAAYSFAQEEIALLEHSAIESFDLATAHNNAGEYLLAMSNSQGRQKLHLLADACTHWQAALSIASRLGLAELARDASRYLKQYWRPDQKNQTVN